MRIVGGKWRSRKIDWPETGNTRPVTDRVKESIFDILSARMRVRGGWSDICVADVFAGGGSMGLEAMSRGAGWACFVDRDARAIQVLKSNLRNLEAGPCAAVIRKDAWRWKPVPPSEFPPFGLLFVDPPFKDAADSSPEGQVAAFFKKAGDTGYTDRDIVVVLRHEIRTVYPDRFAHHWAVEDRREYGRNAVTFLVKYNQDAAADTGGDDDTGFARHGLI